MSKTWRYDPRQVRVEDEKIVVRDRTRRVRYVGRDRALARRVLQAVQKEEAQAYEERLRQGQEQGYLSEREQLILAVLDSIQ